MEYSTNGNNWQKAGSVNASGLSSGSSYSYLHSFATSNRVLYRLKVIDNNGNYTYSAIVILHNRASKKVFVYPTLVQDNILRIALEQPFASLQLIDANGRQVYHTSISGRTGTLQLNLPALATGVYTVVVKNAQEVMLQKVVIE